MLNKIFEAEIEPFIIHLLSCLTFRGFTLSDIHDCNDLTFNSRACLISMIVMNALCNLYWWRRVHIFWLHVSQNGCSTVQVQLHQLNIDIKNQNQPIQQKHIIKIHSGEKSNASNNVFLVNFLQEASLCITLEAVPLQQSGRVLSRAEVAQKLCTSTLTPNPASPPPSTPPLPY